MVATSESSPSVPGPPDPDRSGPVRPGPARFAVPAVAVLVALILGALLAPFPASIGDERTGDPDLAARLRAASEPGQVGLAAAEIGPGGTVTAAIGDDGRGDPLRADAPMEIGSITKTFTGAVLADLVRQGVVRPDDRVRDLVPDRPWRDGGGGDATLAELASHRSGLPRLPVSLGGIVRNYGYTLFGINPYDATPDDTFAAADEATPSGRGEVQYSNLGISLLGHALAARTGTPYPELLRIHVTAPLGMAATAVPAQDPPAGAAIGHDETGRPVQDWISPGDAPAGSGVFSTAADMAVYARAMMDGWAPGVDAAAPRWDAGSLGRIGYSWYTLDRGGRTLLWKNGGSGGMSSSILVDPEQRRAVVVLGNSNASVDDTAFRLIGAPASSGLSSELEPAALIATAAATVLPVATGAWFLATVRGGWGRRATGTVRRSRVVGAAGSTLFGFTAAFVLGAVSWLFAPFWLVGCALAGAGAGIAVLRWRQLDPDRGDGARSRWIGAVGTVVVGLALAVGVSGVFV
ncbi:MAG: serine hydrolase domain-containing protein [Pseudonocardia sediminis]